MHFPGYLSHGMDLFTYLPPFNTTTFIKPMNEKEEEAPLEDSRVRHNHLAQERHVVRSKEQHATDASWRAIQRAAHNNAQIVVDASQRTAQISQCSKVMGTHYCNILSQQVGWLSGKGVCFQSKGQGIKPHGWCCGWSTIVFSPNILLTNSYNRCLSWLCGLLT